MIEPSMSDVRACAVYVDALFARARRSTLIEIRWRTRLGMARRFVAVASRAEAVGQIVDLAARTDVYVGVLPRWRPAGGRSAIVNDARVVWIDIDSSSAAEALERVDPAPSVLVASGGPEHVHAYWTLTAGVPPRVIERANRRLAWALGGDMASTDAPRILRPAGTVNHARGGTRVRSLSEAPDRAVRLGDLVGGLADPPAARPVSTAQRSHGSDALLEVAPVRYVEVLTGRRVGRNGKVRCPLHDDRTASLHVYATPERGWFCFGCRNGGTAYDLAGAIWGVELRGAGFLAVRERLTALLLR